LFQEVDQNWHSYVEDDVKSHGEVRQDQGALSDLYVIFGKEEHDVDAGCEDCIELDSSEVVEEESD
jgi:hypothetical protein